jgi:hypothetical protein
METGGPGLSPTAIEALPDQAWRTLRAVLLAGAGSRLPVEWWNYPSTNFRKRDSVVRERLRQVAVEAGFIEYLNGHPVATERGNSWAAAVAPR